MGEGRVDTAVRTGVSKDLTSENLIRTPSLRIKNTRFNKLFIIPRILF